MLCSSKKNSYKKNKKLQMVIDFVQGHKSVISLEHITFCYFHGKLVFIKNVELVLQKLKCHIIYYNDV